MQVERKCVRNLDREGVRKTEKEEHRGPLRGGGKGGAPAFPVPDQAAKVGVKVFDHVSGCIRRGEATEVAGQGS